MVATTFDPALRTPGSFYVWMAAACALIAFGGFAPTYWLQLNPVTVVGPPLMHLHALLFSLWPLLLLSQTFLAATGRLEHHRAWGLAGIALASALVVVGLATAILSLKTGLAAGYGDHQRAFFIVPVTALAMFGVFFIAAIANLGHPEAHKRLILLATISLLQAAVARVFFVLTTGGGPGLRPDIGMPPPVIFGVAPVVVLELLVLAGIVYDWRTRGRPHPVWLIGAALTVAVAVLRVPVSGTSAWLDFANAASHIAG